MLIIVTFFLLDCSTEPKADTINYSWSVRSISVCVHFPQCMCTNTFSHLCTALCERTQKPAALAQVCSRSVPGCVWRLKLSSTAGEGECAMRAAVVAVVRRGGVRMQRDRHQTWFGDECVEGLWLTESRGARGRGGERTGFENKMKWSWIIDEQRNGSRRNVAAERRDALYETTEVRRGRWREEGRRGREKGKREGRGRLKTVLLELAAGGMPGLWGSEEERGRRGLINQCEIGASVACSHSTTLGLWWGLDPRAQSVPHESNWEGDRDARKTRGGRQRGW